MFKNICKTEFIKHVFPILYKPTKYSSFFSFCLKFPFCSVSYGQMLSTFSSIKIIALSIISNPSNVSFILTVSNLSLK